MYLSSSVEHNVARRYGGKDAQNTLITFAKGDLGRTKDGKPFDFPSDLAEGMIKGQKSKGYAEVQEADLKKFKVPKAKADEVPVSEKVLEVEKEAEVVENTNISEQLAALEALDIDVLREKVGELCGKTFPANTKKETLLKNAETVLTTPTEE